MKKVIKWIAIIILSILVCGALFLFVTNEKLPEGYVGSEADKKADAMLIALNKKAWDELRYVQFTFMGTHHYRWDKVDNVAEIMWKDNKVVLQLDTKEAIVYEDNSPVTDNHYRNSKINKAWEYWCNDSFWFCAPFKVYDPGTSRALVETEEGGKALKVTYGSGGVTPGDSYLYKLGADNIPTSWKMWTKILPAKGFETSWEQWRTLKGGAMIATSHQSPILDIAITNLKSGNTLQELQWDSQTFKYN